MKHQEKVIPFSWESWDQQDTMIFTFYKIEWSEDFGPFKSGDVLSFMDVDYEHGIIQWQTDEDNEQTIQSINFKAISI